jgi:antitoxin HicB
MRYPVNLIREDNGTVTASAPDVPGAHTFGNDEAEALVRVVGAIETVLMAHIADREDIPRPSRPGKRLAVTLPALTVAKIELYETMRQGKISKAALARRLNWHLPQVDRLLDLRHASRLDQIEAAFRVLGRELRVEVRPAA